MIEINQHFRNAMPDLLEDICGARLDCEDPLIKARDAVKALHNYLDFEIQYLDLRIKQLKWESQSDPELIRALTEQVDVLTRFRDAHGPETMTASLEHLQQVKRFIYWLDPSQEEFGSPDPDD